MTPEERFRNLVASHVSFAVGLERIMKMHNALILAERERCAGVVVKECKRTGLLRSGAIMAAAIRAGEDPTDD